MQYAERVCSLLDGAAPTAPVAILYHGEAEWSGRCMLMQKPARVCLDNQIDFLFVPADAFAERDFYRTEIGETLCINGHAFSAFVLPYAQFITPETAAAMAEMQQSGMPVLVLNALPDGLTDGSPLPEALRTLQPVSLEDLWGRLQQCRTVELKPANNRVRVMCCKKENRVLYLFNEGQSSYHGVLSNPFGENVCAYDPWENRLIAVDGDDQQVRVEIPAGASLFLVPRIGRGVSEPLVFQGQAMSLRGFDESVCRCKEYPRFGKARRVEKPESYALQDPKFSGFVRYERDITAGENFTALEITDAYEGVAVYVNGVPAGVQVTPPFRYDLTGLCRSGTNHLTIEVATTLERERGGKDAAPTGITGDVVLYMR